MEFAKPAFDIGLYTNNLPAMLPFWQTQIGVPFSELLKVGNGVHQHRHLLGESILKINSVREPLAESARCGLGQLTINAHLVSTDHSHDTRIDPDGNAVAFVSVASQDIPQLRVQLKVSHLPSHQDFYGDACGFTEVGPRIYACGQSQLELVEGDIPPNPEQRALGYRYLTVQVFDVKAEHAHLLQHGGREGLAPVRLGDVAHISFIRDPDGNWLEVSQRKSITGSLD